MTQESRYSIPVRFYRNKMVTEVLVMVNPHLGTRFAAIYAVVMWANEPTPLYCLILQLLPVPARLLVEKGIENGHVFQQTSRDYIGVLGELRRPPQLSHEPFVITLSLARILWDSLPPFKPRVRNLTTARNQIIR
jgi:hypothetical protein